MPINHQFNCVVPDDPDAAAAGEVLPSHWGQNHVIGDKLTNASGAMMAAGTPAYCSASGAMNLAKGDNAATAECIGLLPVDVAAGQQGLTQELDSMTLTTVQWDARTGDVGGLTPGLRYYVSQTTAGRLVKGAALAASSGLFDTSVGIAITATTMRLNVQPPIGN